jgi:transposase
MGQAIEIKLTDRQREELRGIVRRPSEAAGFVRRARGVLLSDEGVAGREIARRLDLSPEAVSVIRARFRAGGVAGLAERPKAGRKDHAVSAEMEARLVQLAMSPPPAGRSRWTTRLLAKKVGLTSGCVSDVLRRNGLRPHLVRTYKVSRDPDFAAKVKDVVGLYLNPPEHAVVLSVDEKTQIQALERTQLPLPLRSGRATRHTHGLQAPRRARPVRGAGDRYRQRHPSRDREPYGDRLSRLHEPGGAALPAKAASRRARQLVVAQHARGNGLARSTPPRPLHADQRVFAESGRRLLRHPRQAVARRHRLLFQDCAARTSSRVCAPGIGTPRRSPGPSPLRRSSGHTAECSSASRRRCTSAPS